eukprot:scaffold278744_cov17-Tisochrysis_lutea.AAC.1
MMGPAILLEPVGSMHHHSACTRPQLCVHRHVAKPRLQNGGSHRGKLNFVHNLHISKHALNCGGAHNSCLSKKDESFMMFALNKSAQVQPCWQGCYSIIAGFKHTLD